MIKLKSDQDIKNLRIAGERLATILAALKNATQPGVSTADLNDLAEKMILDYSDIPSFLNYSNGSARPFPAAVCISVNQEIVHGIPNEPTKILQEGDLVSYDLGVTHNGMVADAAITVPVGKISEENKILLRATQECLDAGIKAAKLGGHIGDIGHAIAKVADKYSLTIVEGLSGHGVGYDVHEDPFVPNVGKRGEGPQIKSGLVIAIEPMLTFGSAKIKLEKDAWTFSTKDGSNSAHFEHTIAITESGVEVLTKI